MGLLDSLAMGLRGAGGTLNKQVYGGIEQDQAQQAMLQRQMMMEQYKEQQGNAAEQQLASAVAPYIKRGDLEGAAAAAAASGVPGAAKFSLDLYGKAEDRKVRQQEFSDRMTQQRDLQVMAIDQRRDAALATAANQAERNRITEEANQARIAIDAQYKSMMAGIAGMNANINASRLDLERERVRLLEGDRDQKREKVINDQVYKFANDLAQYKVPTLYASITAANDLLSKYEGKDIPGIGLGVGSDKIPNALRSSEAKNVRSKLQAVSNDLLNLYSGLAVTLPESERRALEMMSRGDFTNVDFKNAWPLTVSRFNSAMGNLKAGITPEAVKVYESRPGAIGLKEVKPAFGSKPITPAGTQSGWGIQKVE